MNETLKELRRIAEQSGTAEQELPIGTVRVEWSWLDCKFWLNGDRVSEETLALKMFTASPDPVPAWIAARVEIGGENEAMVSAFYEDFQKWAKLCEVERWLLPSINKFSSILRANGVIIRRQTGGSYPKNIALLPPPTIEEREAIRAAYRGQQ